MATGHWLTNRGKLLLLQGAWDDDAATLIRVGLLVGTQPVAADTAAEVADLNTVNDLLVTAGATECSAGGYARQNLTRSNATEDDANDRVNIDASDVAFGALATGQTIIGAFFYDATTDTNDTTRQLMSVDWFTTGVPTNGGTITYPIADLYRAA
jgi:hypothetical protein